MPGRFSKCAGDGTSAPQTDHRAGPPDHQPATRRSNRRPARRLGQGPLEERKPSAPRPRPHLPRGRLEDPHGPPAPDHGRTPQPRHRRPPPGRTDQHRRRPAGTPPATTTGPLPPSASPDEPGQIAISQRPLPTSCSTGQVHRLPDAPEADGAMITHPKAAPAQGRSPDLSSQRTRKFSVTEITHPLRGVFAYDNSPNKQSRKESA